jgi:hypothetical protein
VSGGIVHSSTHALQGVVAINGTKTANFHQGLILKFVEIGQASVEGLVVWTVVSKCSLNLSFHMLLDIKIYVVCYQKLVSQIQPVRDLLAIMN